MPPVIGAPPDEASDDDSDEAARRGAGLVFAKGCGRRTRERLWFNVGTGVVSVEEGRGGRAVECPGGEEVAMARATFCTRVGGAAAGMREGSWRVRGPCS